MVPSTSLSLKLCGSGHAFNFGMTFWKKNLKMGAYTNRLTRGMYFDHFANKRSGIPPTNQLLARIVHPLLLATYFNHLSLKF